MSPFQSILTIHRATSRTDREYGCDCEELIHTTYWSEMAISSLRDSMAPCN